MYRDLSLEFLAVTGDDLVKRDPPGPLKTTVGGEGSLVPVGDDHCGLQDREDALPLPAVPGCAGRGVPGEMVPPYGLLVLHEFGPVPDQRNQLHPGGAFPVLGRKVNPDREDGHPVARLILVLLVNGKDLLDKESFPEDEDLHIGPLDLGRPIRGTGVEHVDLLPAGRPDSFLFRGFVSIEHDLEPRGRSLDYRCADVKIPRGVLISFQIVSPFPCGFSLQGEYDLRFLLFSENEANLGGGDVEQGGCDDADGDRLFCYHPTVLRCRDDDIFGFGRYCLGQRIRRRCLDPHGNPSITGRYPDTRFIQPLCCHSPGK